MIKPITWLAKLILRPFFFLVLLLINLIIGKALLSLPWNIIGENAVAALLSGTAFMIIFLWKIANLNRCYVFFHEITHLLVSKIFHRKTSRLRVNSKTGSILVERPNLWIALSPYLIPLPALTWFAIMTIWQTISPIPPRSSKFLMIFFVLGTCYGFHLFYTIKSLRISQTDFQYAGRWNSILLISATNLLIIFLTISINAYSLNATIGHLINTLKNPF